MTSNVMKKGNAPVVEKSLEATRNIEYQLLNMKEGIEKLSINNRSDIDLTPAVNHTLEVLQNIEAQLQNMRSLLDNYSNLDRAGEHDNEISIEKSLEMSAPESPFPPTSPPPYPPTYPEHQSMDPHQQQYPHAYYQYPPHHYPPYYGPSYYPPMQLPPPFPQYYGHPYFQQQQPYQYPYPYPAPQYNGQYPPEQHPQQQYGQTPPDDRYYSSAKYPTVASSEPAYTSKSSAIPKQTFKIAYYPWQQLIGNKSVTDSRVPYVNMYDLGGEYLVHVELPGVEKDNLELRVDEQSIWINGKPTVDGSEQGTPVVQEHGYHEFFRQLNLPSKIVTNKTKCQFENGILKILLPKNNPKKLLKKIKIE